MEVGKLNIKCTENDTVFQNSQQIQNLYFSSKPTQILQASKSSVQKQGFLSAETPGYNGLQESKSRNQVLRQNSSRSRTDKYFNGFQSAREKNIHNGYPSYEEGLMFSKREKGFKSSQRQRPGQQCSKLGSESSIKGKQDQKNLGKSSLSSKRNTSSQVTLTAFQQHIQKHTFGAQRFSSNQAEVVPVLKLQQLRSESVTDLKQAKQPSLVGNRSQNKSKKLPVQLNQQSKVVEKQKLILSKQYLNNDKNTYKRNGFHSARGESKQPQVKVPPLQKIIQAQQNLQSYQSEQQYSSRQSNGRPLTAHNTRKQLEQNLNKLAQQIEQYKISGSSLGRKAQDQQLLQRMKGEYEEVFIEHQDVSFLKQLNQKPIQVFGNPSFEEYNQYSMNEEQDQESTLQKIDPYIHQRQANQLGQLRSQTSLKKLASNSDSQKSQSSQQKDMKQLQKRQIRQLQAMKSGATAQNQEDSLQNMMLVDSSNKGLCVETDLKLSRNVIGQYFIKSDLQQRNTFTDVNSQNTYMGESPPKTYSSSKQNIVVKKQFKEDFSSVQSMSAISQEKSGNGDISSTGGSRSQFLSKLRFKNKVANPFTVENQGAPGMQKSNISASNSALLTEKIDSRLTTQQNPDKNYFHNYATPSKFEESGNTVQQQITNQKSQKQNNQEMNYFNNQQFVQQEPQFGNQLFKQVKHKNFQKAQEKTKRQKIAEEAKHSYNENSPQRTSRVDFIIKNQRTKQTPSFEHDSVLQVQSYAISNPSSNEATSGVQSEIEHLRAKDNFRSMIAQQEKAGMNLPSHQEMLELIRLQQQQIIDQEQLLKEYQRSNQNDNDQQMILVQHRNSRGNIPSIDLSIIGGTNCKHQRDLSESYQTRVGETTHEDFKEILGIFDSEKQS